MNNILTCLIIEDEPLAQNLIEKYIKRVPFLKLEGICSNAIDGLGVIKNQKPSIVFLDINMPEMTGMELLSVLGIYKPAIIITTGYPDFAVESYSFDVTDYLLKPISFEKFMRSISKVQEKIEIGSVQGGAYTNQKSIKLSGVDNTIFEENYIYLTVGKKKLKVFFDEIIFVEGMKDYIKIHINSGQNYLIHHTMKKMEDILQKSRFMRINRSYIINEQFIRSIEGNQIELTNTIKLDIGVTYREEILAKLRI